LWGFICRSFGGLCLLFAKGQRILWMIMVMVHTGRTITVALAGCPFAVAARLFHHIYPAFML
jgi:hypothetical protein